MTAQLLLINPNTSPAITALLAQYVGAVLAPDLGCRAVTARFGPTYISDETGSTIAAHAVLDAWSHALQDAPAPHAVLLGCFGDPGLLALRECSPVPVSGLAECAFHAAAPYGRFAIVTGGARWVGMLQRLAYSLGFAQALAGVHTVTPTGAQLAADPAGARALLLQACRDAQQRWAADAIIVGGAGLAGMAAQLQPSIDIPLIDSVQAAGLWAREQLCQAPAVAPAPDAAVLAALRELPHAMRVTSAL